VDLRLAHWETVRPVGGPRGRLLAGGSGTEWGEALRAVLLATAAALAVVSFAPPPGDASAHLYRTWLVERGVIVWDNLWFAGNYPILTYSPLYYFLAAAAGNGMLTIAGALVAAACFAALAVREWGPTAAWPARLFGICAAGPLITGTAPYGLGLAAALACLLALQRRWWIPAFALAAVTLAFSALAFFFLVLALGAVALSRRCTIREVLTVGFVMAALAACWATLWLLVPSQGRYPYSWLSLLAAGGVAACGVRLALGTRSASLLAAFFGLWLVSCVVCYLVPTPMGETVTRLRYVVLPLMLLTVLHARARPRWLAAIALAGAAAYNTVPYAVSLALRVAGDGNAAEQGYWQPTIDFLRANHSDDHLVAVVATGSHWESYYLPKAGIPVVRGWFRQTDMVRNEVLYDSSADAGDYVRWLHDNAVRYVVLPDVRLDAYTGEREEDLVRAAAADLALAMRTDDVTIYEVPNATPLLTGPGRARVTELTHDEVRGVVGASGTYRLRLTWSPYWRVVNGAITVREATDGQMLLDARKPGEFAIEVPAGALLP